MADKFFMKGRGNPLQTDIIPANVYAIISLIFSKYIDN